VDRDDWNRRYTEKELVWSAEPNQFLVQEISELAPGRAIDLAAGEGRNAVWLAERGWRVTAVDYSRVGLDKARQIAKARGVDVEWVEADLLEFAPQPGGFDLVLLLYLQLPWNWMRDVVQGAARAVAPGGTFLLVGHDRKNLDHGHGGPKDPDVLYTPRELTAELGELQVIEADRRQRSVDTDEGSATAIDCLVRAVASK